jgi:hypothetical protein
VAVDAGVLDRQIGAVGIVVVMRAVRLVRLALLPFNRGSVRWRQALALGLLGAHRRAYGNRTLLGIPSNDVLNVREQPTSQSRIVGLIAPNGTGIVYEMIEPTTAGGS